MADYGVLDEALETISFAAPELANGFTNHAPMVVEALCAMGRSKCALSWLDKYRKQLIPSPPLRAKIEAGAWRGNLGRFDLVADWRVFFENELQEAHWTDVLDRWAARLAPGFCAAATHGPIRAGHAARALAASETEMRRAELANALAYWAATYQTLPADVTPNPSAKRPSESIHYAPILPESRRRFAGSISSALEGLADFNEFAPVINSADLSGSFEQVLSELTETFARVFLANAHDALSATIFVHCVTSIGAVRLMSPHVGNATALELARYAWQSACGIHCVFGSHHSENLTEAVGESEDNERLIDLAVENGDEHVIKFAEACTRENRERPTAIYGMAVRHALDAFTRNA